MNIPGYTISSASQYPLNILGYTTSSASVPCEYPRVCYIISLSTLWISQCTLYHQPQYLVNILGCTVWSASVPCEYPRVHNIKRLSTLWISQCTLYHQPRYPVNIPGCTVWSALVPCEYPAYTVSSAHVPCEYPRVHYNISPGTLWISQGTLYHHPVDGRWIVNDSCSSNKVNRYTIHNSKTTLHYSVPTQDKVPSSWQNYQCDYSWVAK